MYGFITPSPLTIMIVLGLGVLFFGKNLPEVARQVGLGLLEFKKGMNEFNQAVSTSTPSVKSSARRERSDAGLESSMETFSEVRELSGAKFEPPQEG